MKHDLVIASFFVANLMIQENMFLLISNDELGLFDISTNQFMDKIPGGNPRGFLKNKPNTIKELNKVELDDYVYNIHDGKYACFTERNWNSLTYIVHGNSQSTEMVKTNYLGSFPLYHQGKICFISDPSFVKLGENEGFRQIEEYALYSYNIDKKELELVLQPQTEFYILERD